MKPEVTEYCSKKIEFQVLFPHWNPTAARITAPHQVKSLYKICGNQTQTLFPESETMENSWAQKTKLNIKDDDSIGYWEHFFFFKYKKQKNEHTISKLRKLHPCTPYPHPNPKWLHFLKSNAVQIQSISWGFEEVQIIS
jgi:hypothetical protein